MMIISIKKATDNDKSWIKQILIKYWSSEYVVIRGRLYNATEYEALISWFDQKRCGLLIYLISGKTCEIISLSSEIENIGIATKLLDHLSVICQDKKCREIKLVTTNDNTSALRFYQKRGFVIANLYKNSINEISRKLKPGIPLSGLNDIPLRDEIELIYQLD